MPLNFYHVYILYLVFLLQSCQQLVFKLIWTFWPIVDKLVIDIIL